VRVSSLLCIPILSTANETIGAISILNKRGEGASGGSSISFNAEDVEASNELGGLVARAIQNNQEDSASFADKKNADAFGETITDLLSNLDMREFPDILCKSLLKSMDCEQAYIFLFDHYLERPTQGHLVFWGYANTDVIESVSPHLKESLKADIQMSTIINRVAKMGQPCTVMDLPSHPDRAIQAKVDKTVLQGRSFNPTENLMAFPILLNGGVIGVVQVCNRYCVHLDAETHKMKAFDKDDAQLLERFAAMVAISTSKILNIERQQSKMATFMTRESHRKGIILLNFILTKMRLATLHRILSAWCVQYESSVQGVRTDHRKNVGVHNMTIRTWMLSTYIMSKLRMHKENYVLEEWRTNYFHHLFVKGASGKVNLKDRETQTTGGPFEIEKQTMPQMSQDSAAAAEAEGAAQPAAPAPAEGAAQPAAPAEGAAQPAASAT